MAILDTSIARQAQCLRRLRESRRALRGTRDDELREGVRRDIDRLLDEYNAERDATS